MSLPAVNPLINRLSAPPIPAVQAWARDYDGSRGALIDLSQAVPGYPPHPDMLRFLGEAAGSVASAGYGPIEGEKILRGAYAAYVGQLYRAQIDVANVHITSGCNQAFIAAIMCVAQSGDTVLTTDPFYFNHRSSLEMLGIASGSVPCHAMPGMASSPAWKMSGLRFVRVLRRWRLSLRTIQRGQFIRMGSLQKFMRSVATMEHGSFWTRPIAILWPMPMNRRIGFLTRRTGRRI